MTEVTKVWVFQATTDDRVWMPIVVMPGDHSRFELDRDEMKHWAAVSTDYHEALIKDADVLPKSLTGRKLDITFRRLPDFFIGAGFYIFSQACVDVVQSFDLGYGGFSPVVIYQGDRKSFIADRQFYILYFGCQKQAFMPELSNLAALYNKTPVRGGYMRYSGTIDDGDCVLGSEALGGADLWVDLTVSRAFFMSDRLAGALGASGLAKNMAPKKCKVIEGSAAHGGS